MRIFLSYASEDRPVAESLAISLAQEGHDVFFDRTSLPAGDAFHARIRDGIEAADLVVFLVSPDSVASNGYARTELNLTHEKWKNPSGKVLPVIVRPTSFADLPAYLKAVTVLEPQGNVEAEVLAQIARMQRRPRRRLLWIGATCAAIAALAVAWIVRSGNNHTAQLATCFLDATVRPIDDAASAPLDALAIEVAYQGAAKAFIVSASGRARVDVGPLTPETAQWIIALHAPDGTEIGRESMVGCPASSRTLEIADRYAVVVGPRSP